MEQNNIIEINKLKETLKELCRVNNELVVECDMLKKAISPEDSVDIVYRPKHFACPRNGTLDSLESQKKILNAEFHNLKIRRELLRGICPLLSESAETKYRFIADHPEFPETKWLRALNLGPNGYYRWKKRREEQGTEVQHSVEKVSRKEPALQGNGISIVDIRLQNSILISWEWKTPSPYSSWVDIQSDETDFKPDEKVIKSCEVGIPPGSYLVCSLRMDHTEAYEPLKDDILFTRFASIENPDRFSFLTWAVKYGSLFNYVKTYTLSEEAALRVFGDPDNPGRLFRPMDSFDCWYKAHEELSQATNLWESWHNKDEASLKKITPWFKEYFQHNTSMIYGENEEGKSLPESDKQTDIITLASIYLQKMVHKKLQDHPFNAAFKRGGNEQLEALLYPRDLLSAMWYQLFCAVNDSYKGKTRLKRCEICGHWESMVGRRSDWKAHEYCRHNFWKEINRKK